MPEADNFKPQNRDEQLNRIVREATERARAKTARLRHLKERNELYLAEQRGEDDRDEDETKEL